MAVLISGVESTELFVGEAENPLQVVRVYLAQDDLYPYGGPVTLTVHGSGVTTPEPLRVRIDPGERERRVEVAVRVPESSSPGDVLRIVATVEGDFGRVDREDPIVVAEPGWTMYMVSHFHFDPVWWNTQSNYTEEWKGWGMPRHTFQTSAFGLLDRHIERATHDLDYTFVVAEIDYLKPYWDARPEQRPSIRRLLAEGRLEVMGGTYNEPSTNLSGVEATARNAVYGSGFQRDVMGADPQTAWQLDVFGHDPQFPGLMASAGLTSTSWARGPFHQNGPTYDYLGNYPLFFSRSTPFRDSSTIRDPERMEFPSEFEWISPNGAGLLTSYMHNHYLGGWAIDAAETLEEAEESAYELFRLMKRSTATKNLLLPFGTDYAVPSRWVTDIHRDWSTKYVWPRFVTGIPRDFFAAVREDLAEEGRVLTPQTRDMNPIWTGKDVSLIDTKQAQRELESVLVDAEKFATLAALRGVDYPEDELDLAWRQVFFGAHHDAVTGTGSDQVYVDLLGSWREAYDIALELRAQTVRELAGAVETTGEGDALVVVNSLATERTDVVRGEVTLPAGQAGLRVVDADGSDVPFVVEDVTDAADGQRVVQIALVARAVPSLGVTTYRVLPSDADLPRWSTEAGVTSASNEFYEIAVSAEQGGALSSIFHRASGRELLQQGRAGAEIVVHDEYPAHPNMGEGPWMLVPTGASTGSASIPATEVRAETSPVGTRLVVRGEVDGVVYEQHHTLWGGVDRVDGLVRVEHFDGADKLLRLRLPVDVAGARPVMEVGEAVVGRPIGFPEVDSATAPWTLDTPANRWFAAGATARVVTSDGTAAEALGVAEVVVHRSDAADSGARELVVALAQVGVTATVTSAAGPRYGNLDVDSNLPDVRVAVGLPQENAFVESVLVEADPAYRAELERQLAESGTARVWVPATRSRADRLVPMADLRGTLDLPVLVVAGPGALAAVVEDLGDGTVELTQDAGLARLHGLDDLTVALVNRGTPGSVLDAEGSLQMSLMRSSTGWPSGVWIDPPRRTVPDGSTFHQQHWTHDFTYAVVAGTGDWRSAGFVEHGLRFNHDLVSTVEQAHEGTIAPRTSLLSIEPAGRVTLGALKLAGNPVATGAQSPETRGVTMRLTQTTGEPTSARITLPGGWDSAHRATLLEEPTDELVAGDAIEIDLGATDVVTVTAVPRTGTPTVAAPDSTTRYARYWLHNRGAAPAGFVPVSVHVAQRWLPGTQDRALDVTVASNLTDRSTTGRLEVTGPDGWTVVAAQDTYDLAAGVHVTVPVTVTVPEGAADGTYTVEATIVDEAGSSVVDVARVVVGEPSGGERGPAGEIELHVSAETVSVARGAATSIDVTVTNTTPDEIEVELHTVAPFAAWGAVPEPAHYAVAPAGGSTTVTVPLRGDVPVGTYWVLPKAMWNGEVAYAEAVTVAVTA